MGAFASSLFVWSELEFLAPHELVHQLSHTERRMSKLSLFIRLGCTFRDDGLCSKCGTRDSHREEMDEEKLEMSRHSVSCLLFDFCPTQSPLLNSIDGYQITCDTISGGWVQCNRDWVVCDGRGRKVRPLVSRWFRRGISTWQLHFDFRGVNDSSPFATHAVKYNSNTQNQSNHCNYAGYDDWQPG